MLNSIGLDLFMLKNEWANVIDVPARLRALILRCGHSFATIPREAPRRVSPYRLELSMSFNAWNECSLISSRPLQ